MLAMLRDLLPAAMFDRSQRKRFALDEGSMQWSGAADGDRGEGLGGGAAVGAADGGGVGAVVLAGAIDDEKLAVASRERPGLLETTTPPPDLPGDLDPPTPLELLREQLAEERRVRHSTFAAAAFPPGT